MTPYQQILLALDLHPNADFTLIKKAQNLAKTFGAKWAIVHAVEHINGYGIGQAYPEVLDIEGDLVKAARAELAKMCEPFGIAAVDQIVSVGSPKSVLFETAKERKADLIIVGSHGRHGLGLLLGSTASSVLHNAACDVLAIRIRDDDDIS